MDTVGIAVASVPAALLVARELMWRRAFVGLSERIAADGIQIREQEQFAQVGQPVSGLAQELKSPLQGVIGHTELMQVWSGDLLGCRRVVRAHGGSLEVDRPAYGGYRVHLELPVTAGGTDPITPSLPNGAFPWTTSSISSTSIASAISKS
jgi:signal transduction histidine kinase